MNSLYIRVYYEIFYENVLLFIAPNHIPLNSLRTRNYEVPYSELLDKIPKPTHYDYESDSSTIGFQVQRVKYAETGVGKVRLTAYYKSTDKVVQSETSPMTCSTVPVASDFKYRYHVFGQQEATFQDVRMEDDMVLVARFYLRKSNDESSTGFTDPPPSSDRHSYDDDSLVAWSAMPLMITRNGVFRINTGTHILKLFKPPIPEVAFIPTQEQNRPKDWVRYGKANVRIHIFQGRPRPGSLTPSDMSEDEEENCPEFAWLAHERTEPLTDPFTATDGFDLYIDGCRNLPDLVTITRIAGRLLDRRYEKIGKDVMSTAKLNSDIYNPVYEERFEFREPNIPPSATFLLKLYTIDKFYKNLVVCGYAALNLFVETGTNKQPSTDSGGVQVSLNEGAHQVRIYQHGPNGVDVLKESYFVDDGIRHVPCATLVLRIVKAPLGPKGKALEAEKVPKIDWPRLGLWQPRPNYADRVYSSMKCLPSTGECKLFHTLINRNRVTVREAISMIAEAKEVRSLKTDKAIEDMIRVKLTKLMDVTPMDLDLTFVAQYSPKHGIKVSVDSAMNIPWSNFTLAHYCLTPPGAFYMGQPQASYDKLVFTQKLDLKSTNKSPAWRDGYHHFLNRSFHRFLVLVVHLQELSVAVSSDSYKYGLLQQAWTGVQVFNDGYCNTHTYQLPLFQGAPKPHVLNQLSREPFKDWMIRSVRSGTLVPLDNASVFVRLADGRRDDELLADVPQHQMVELNMDYIPPDQIQEYGKAIKGVQLETLVPQGKTPQQFQQSLVNKFRSLVYKLYEEGNAAAANG